MSQDPDHSHLPGSYVCHGTCAYCDDRGRGSRRDVGTRSDAPLPRRCTRTESELVLKPKAPVCTIAPEGNRDPYDTAEGRCELTRRQLEAARDAGLSALVITRSDRVVRDLPLLAEIAGSGGATVLVAVATADPELAALWEPDTPPPSSRLAVLRPLAEAGVAAGLLAAPLVPFLMDDHAQLRALLVAAAHAGAQFFVTETAAARLEPSRERTMQLFAERWPQLLAPLNRLYDESPRPAKAYGDRVAGDACRIGVMLGLPHGMPRSWSPGALLGAAFSDRLRIGSRSPTEEQEAGAVGMIRWKK